MRHLAAFSFVGEPQCRRHEDNASWVIVILVKWPQCIDDQALFQFAKILWLDAVLAIVIALARVILRRIIHLPLQLNFIGD